MGSRHDTLATYRELYQDPGSPIARPFGSYERRDAGPSRQEAAGSREGSPRVLRRRDPPSLRSPRGVIIVDDTRDTNPIILSPPGRSRAYSLPSSSNPGRIGDRVDHSPSGKRVRFSSVYNENGMSVSSRSAQYIDIRFALGQRDTPYHSRRSPMSRSPYAPFESTYYPGYGETSPTLGPSYRPTVPAGVPPDYSAITGMDPYAGHGRPQAYKGSIYVPGTGDGLRREATRVSSSPETETRGDLPSGASEHPSPPSAPQGSPPDGSLPPDLTGQVKKTRPRPLFDGTYSTVYEGVLGEEKVIPFD